MKITEERLQHLKELEKTIMYEFKDICLLNQSLTHSSYAYETEKDKGCQNERLEFLGDVVLSLVVSEYLYQRYPDSPEGKLAKIRAMIVSRPILAHLAKEINMGNYVLLGKGEEQAGGRKRSSTLANTIEAVFGAMYLDGGFEPARNFIMSLYGDELIKLSYQLLARDYKTELQEFVQNRFKVLPVYTLVSRKGPDHNQIFSITVSIKGQVWGQGDGKSKKDAQQNAAYHALKKWEETEDRVKVKTTDIELEINK